MQNELNALKEKAIASYKKSNSRDDMQERFANGFAFKKGKKYIKVTQDRAVWCFVVATDDDEKFRKGDILKAASWSTPARNAARGNILDGNYSVHWTGPHYLK